MAALNVVGDGHARVQTTQPVVQPTHHDQGMGLQVAATPSANVGEGEASTSAVAGASYSQLLAGAGDSDMEASGSGQQPARKVRVRLYTHEAQNDHRNTLMCPFSPARLISLPSQLALMIVRVYYSDALAPTSPPFRVFKPPNLNMECFRS
jgi:hypothetical protein